MTKRSEERRHGLKSDPKEMERLFAEDRFGKDWQIYMDMIKKKEKDKEKDNEDT